MTGWMAWGSINIVLQAKDFVFKLIAVARPCQFSSQE